MDYLLTRFDKLVTNTFSEWDRLSTTLFVLSISSLIYFVITTRDPDTHPLLLARQSHASPVRQSGESAIFRSHSTPHDVPLASGLNIKTPGQSKWVYGKDGDLRDVWRGAVFGARDSQGNKTGEMGKLFTIRGTKDIIEHDLNDITRQINLIGQYLINHDVDRVAIYLPNSVEFLASLFACAFHDVTAILLQYDQHANEIFSCLEQSNADTVIAAAGSIPFDAKPKNYLALKQLILVVDEGSKHINWNEAPAESSNSINVTTWQNITQNQEASSKVDSPTTDEQARLKKIIAFTAGEMVEYTHANIIAGVAGQLTSIPLTQSFTPSDIFLPVDCLSAIYPLTLTLSALYSNASVALTAVASKSPSLSLATRGILPTVIVASTGTIMKYHKETAEKMSSPLYKLVHWFETRELTRNGIMPAPSLLSGLFDRFRLPISSPKGNLRLIFVSTLAGVDKPISSSTLSDLRIYTKSRVIYALTAPKVAGAVAQTGVYDYRISKNSHFGAPVTSLELYFQDKDPHNTTDTVSCGELIVAGPAVVDGKANIGVLGMMNDDLTLSLLEN